MIFLSPATTLVLTALSVLSLHHPVCGPPQKQLFLWPAFPSSVYSEEVNLYDVLKIHVSLRNFCSRIKLFCVNISKDKIVFHLARTYILQVRTHKCKSFMNGFCLCKLFVPQELALPQCNVIKCRRGCI